MSNWTHVSAVFRVDDICSQNFDFDKIFGKECIWDDDNWDKFHEAFNEARSNPQEFLPMGSEGSLHKTVWVNPDTSAIARFVITVWGDIRDHESVGEIEDWFRGCCKKLDGWVRQAVIAIDNERNGSKTITYRLDNEIV